MYTSGYVALSYFATLTPAQAIGGSGFTEDARPESGRTSEPVKSGLDQTGFHVNDPYEQLKESIYLGDLEPGQQLIESAVAQSLRVSRTPVREALARLEQDGLVVRTRSGLAVRDRTPGEVLDIYDVRVLLESAAGRAAAERRTNNDILELRQAQRRYVAAGNKDQNDF